MNQIHVSAAFCKLYIFLKIGCENLWILETSRGKSHNSETSLDKMWVLTIPAKYLHKYGTNCAIKESSARKL